MLSLEVAGRSSSVISKLARSRRRCTWNWVPLHAVSYRSPVPGVYDHGAAMEEFTVKELVCSKDVSLRRDTCNFESRRPDLRLMLGLLRRCSWSDAFLVRRN